MTKLLPQYKRSTVYALIGVVFHFVIVVVPLILFVGIFEQRDIQRAFGYLLLFLDFPLIILETKNPVVESFVFSSKLGLLIYYSFGGTVLYALGGWFIGYVTEKYYKYS
jgi:hypothetical protein